MPMLNAMVTLNRLPYVIVRCALSLPRSPPPLFASGMEPSHNRGVWQPVSFTQLSSMVSWVGKEGKA